MEEETNIWIYWNEDGVATLLHANMICFCKQRKKKGFLSEKKIPYNDKFCVAKKFIDRFKTIPAPSNLKLLEGWVYVVAHQKHSTTENYKNAKLMLKQFTEANLSLEQLGFKQLHLEYTPTQPRHEPLWDHDLITKLAIDYFAAVTKYPEHVCHFCMKQCYKDGVRNLVISEEQVRLYSDYEKLLTGSRVKVCIRCLENIKKNKILSTYKFNNMMIPASPTVLSDLSDAELQLISPVRPFQKIFNLREGRGQHAVKGTCIYFAQSVEEVVEQLPMNSQDAGVAVVTEFMENIKKAKELEVRPSFLYKSLQWLKENNVLFRNIQIVQKSYDQLDCSSSVVVNDLGSCRTEHPINVQNDIGDIGDDNTFQLLHNGIKILRGHFHQGEGIFPDYSRNKQCTANCAMFLCMTLTKDIASWTNYTVDKILTLGDQLYRDIYRNLPDNIREITPYLEVEDLNVTVDLDGTPIVIQPDTENVYQFSGLLRCAINDQHLSQEQLRLSSRLRQFFLSQFDKAILTTRSYAVALYKINEYVFLFDPHSRGPKGNKACNGKACVFQYEKATADVEIEALISRTFNNEGIISESQRQNYQFTIQPLTFANSGNIMEVDRERHEETAMEICDEPCMNDLIGSQLCPLAMCNTTYDERISSMEHVNIHVNDHIEPEAREYIKNLKQKDNYTVYRKTGPPLREQYVDHLDELSFLNCYPYGTHGYAYKRPFKISILDYYQTLLLSGDKRFQTPGFLFYALNRVENFKLSQLCNVVADLEVEGQAQTVIKDETLVHLSLKGIRGSASYWKSYGGDLNAMIHQLGSPTLFITVSFDDLNSYDCVNATWKSQNGFETNVNPEMLSYEEKKKILDNNPLAAARHFNLRLKEILKLFRKKGKEIFGYEVANYAGRVEFQMRGSPHAHMLLWLKDVPAFDTAAGRLFIERNMSCSLETPYAEKVRKYQMHKCTATCYKDKNKKLCRFHFPFLPTTELQILDDDETLKNHGRSIILKRTENESMVNTYHPVLLNILLCNHDIQVITNAAGAAYYIAKYVAKNEPEKFRQEVNEAIKCASNMGSPSSRLKSIVFKIHNKREVSGQECIFRLCHIPLHFSSVGVDFVPAFVKSKRLRYLRNDSLMNGNVQFRTNIIEKYEMRPLTEHNMCLFEFAAMYEPEKRKDFEKLNEDIDFEDDELVEGETGDHDNNQKLVLRDRRGNKKGVMRKRRFPKVIKIPRFQPNEVEEQLYAHLLLFYPFKEESVFEQYPDIKSAYECLKGSFRTHLDNNIIPSSFAEEFERMLLRVHEILYEDDHEDQEQTNEDILDLGCEEELDNDLPIANLVLRNFNMQEFSLRVQSLNQEQKQVYALVNAKVENILSNTLTDPLRLFVTGGGGVGKSYVINTIYQLISQKLYSNLGPSVLLCAPTGVAALNINACTLHSAFKLGIEKYTTSSYKKLGSKLREALRRKFAFVKFIIIDEISMVSYQVLRMINLRLIEIFSDPDPEMEHLPFAGLNIIVFGDLFQLPPCHGSPVYKQPEFCSAEIDLWRLFKYVELHVNQRQSVSDPLLGICNRLRVGETTIDDISILLTRQLDNLRVEEQNFFEDAIRIFPTCKQVNKYNEKTIQQMETCRGVQVFNISARDTFCEGAKAGQELDQQTKAKIVPKLTRDCGGFSEHLRIFCGQRVMLKRNISVSSGLVNGSIGTITRIAWPGNRPRQLDEELPSKIFIKFDNNLTDVSLDHCGSYGLAARSVEVTGKRGRKFNRLGFPIVPCYAVTCHAMQGTTLNKAVIDLGTKNFEHGQLYTALSRVRTLEGVAISALDAQLIVGEKKRKPCDQKVIEEYKRLQV